MFVADAYNGNLGYFWMLIQQFFYFFGVYVEPADVYHVFFTVNYINITLFVFFCHVPCP